MAQIKKTERSEKDLTPKQRLFVDILVANWGEISYAEACKQAKKKAKKKRKQLKDKAQPGLAARQNDEKSLRPQSPQLCRQSVDLGKVQARPAAPKAGTQTEPRRQ